MNPKKRGFLQSIADTVGSFFADPKKQQQEVDDYQAYWDKMRQQAAAGHDIPETVSPDRQTINFVLGRKEEEPSFLSKILSFLEPKMLSPVPESGQTLGAVQAAARLPSATPTPTPAPSQTMRDRGDTFDFSGYKIQRPGFENATIPQPPEDIANIIWDTFAPRNEATPAAAVAWSENGRFNPRAEGVNTGGSIDRGIFQINDMTFNGLMKRRPKQMEAIGVNSFEDMYDPVKNAKVAELIRIEEDEAGTMPFGRWFGWQGKGKSGNYLGKDINLQEMLRKLQQQNE